jgi:hypothetical protein
MGFSMKLPLAIAVAGLASYHIRTSWAGRNPFAFPYQKVQESFGTGAADPRPVRRRKLACGPPRFTLCVASREKETQQRCETRAATGGPAKSAIYSNAHQHAPRR